MKRFTLSSFALTGYLLAGTAAALAQTTYVWDPGKTGESNTTGTWDTSTQEWYNGSTDIVWPNTTSSAAVFGNSSTANSFTVTVSGTMAAAGINIAEVGSVPSFTLQSGTINGSGTFTIQSTDFFNNSNLAGITFKGATSYQFTTGSKSGIGEGLNLTNYATSTTFDQNVVLGTGADYGTIRALQPTIFSASGKSVTVKTGWSYILEPTTSSTNLTYSDPVTITGFGDRGFGALATFPNGSASVTTSGGITLNGDAAITGINGTVFNVSSIGGTGNLYLGYSNEGTPSATTALIVSGTNTYSGDTVVYNSIRSGNNTGTGGVTAYAVKIGADNALPTATTLVLGETYTTAPLTGLTAPSAQVPTGSTGSGGTNSSDGAFDLNGYNQTVAGLAVGAGRTGSNQFIGNTYGATGESSINGTRQVATLTVNGSTTPSAGFGGIIEDNFGNGATGKVALAMTGGSLSLTGANTYSGGTAVNSTGGSIGNLYADSTSGSATGSGTVTVTGTSSSSYGVLGGGSTNLGSTATRGSGITGKVYGSSNEVVTGTVSVSGFGHIAPGDTVGTPSTIEVGALTLGSGGNADFDFTSTANDYILVDGALTLNSGIVFNLNFAGISNPTGLYDLIGYATDSGYSASDFSFTGLANGYTASVVDDTSDKVLELNVTASSTPEPSAWAMLFAGLGTLVFIRRLRVRA